MKTPILKTILIAILLTSVQGISTAAKPLKVFILAGQSNMQGKGHVSTFDYIGMDPKTAPMLKEMRNADGTPVVLDKVWISELGSGMVASEERHGKLTAEYGSANKGPHIGPEYTFGIYMYKHLKEPFLIIKTAWGGRSLNTAFRSPSAGPFPLPEGATEEEKKAKAKETGDAYRMMMDHVKKVLADPARVCPAYDPAAGYELAGFVWFQGWNDLVDRHVYPNSDFSAYTELLAHFIRDVRKELKAPKMPFVVGVLGVGGKKDADHPFRKAMAAPAGMPEFKGNVFNVFTADSWDDELDELFNRGWRATDAKYDPEGRYAKIRAALLEHEKQQSEAKDLSRNERREMGQKRLDILYTPEEQLKLKGSSNKPYHYLGAAKIYGQIGKAFAETMAEAMKTR